MTTRQYIPYIRKIVGKEHYVDVKNVMVMGGGRTAVRAVKTMPEYMDVKIIEMDEKRCEQLNTLLDDDTMRSEEHTSELQSRQYLVCRLLLEKKKNLQAEKRCRCKASACGRSRTATRRNARCAGLSSSATGTLPPGRLTATRRASTRSCATAT